MAQDEKRKNLFFKWIVSAVFFLSALGGLVAFLVQKPIPKISIWANFCEMNEGLYSSLQELKNLNGEVVYLDLYVLAAIDFDTTGNTQHRMTSPPDTEENCYLLKNPDLIPASVSGKMEIPFDVNFHYTAPDKSNVEQVRYDGFNLYVPGESQNFVEVNFPGTDAYTLNGALRVSQILEGEGNVGIALSPIDVNLNAELAKKFECRLKIERASHPILGWLECLT